MADQPANNAPQSQSSHSFLDRLKGFFGFDNNNVDPEELRNSKDIEIHTWNGPNDPENPFNWSLKYKWLLTVTVCFISILTGLPAGTYGSGNDWMEEKFHVQNSPFPNLYWATTSWNMGAAFWPLIFVPLTESSGRMPGYFVAYVILVISLFPSAFANNFATLVVTRFFGGGASSVSINIVGGSISDVWLGEKARSLPMSLFGFTSVVGIALGPFIGSAIVQIHKSDPWRWIFYIQIIYNAALIPVFYLILSETRPDVILKKRARKIRKETGRPVYAQAELDKVSTLKLLQISFQRPTRMLLTEPVVIFFTLWISFAWGILYLFFSSVVQTYSTNYGWGIMATGLVQLAISVGAVIGTAINPLQDWIYQSSAKRNSEKPGKPIPEARLYTAIPGSLLFAGGLFWYGWASMPDVHWIVPTIGITAAGIGIYSIYMAVVNYLTDAYEKYAASALSAASLGRNSFGAFLPLASPQLFSNLGFGWAGSLLGFIGIALSVVPVVLVLKGPQIRHRSPFMRESMWTSDEVDEKDEPSAEKVPTAEIP
ncbi:major facilitator superfamily domain-containing protein [Aspergillus pseudonomiae]|uniref:Major facilitator superfamily domain-containing protein n=1 Tax=Aspergillus pseudonomiae TaxID=1506151 RepID=A0A5N6HPF3_9EURO|nr:major facilitator superfamily domain-containing protein [Aspergillus pseudonomiae]KAB8256316.1 major facilitator superfamily domain-containing protein [Aspergillus pseudonomiae]KAE8405505.1 major facilitator superfamily domain-containing protein [Aspergillus pseudonomiae]